jgi:hypothetical protein
LDKDLLINKKIKWPTYFLPVYSLLNCRLIDCVIELIDFTRRREGRGTGIKPREGESVCIVG